MVPETISEEVSRGMSKEVSGMRKRTGNVVEVVFLVFL